MPCVGMPCLFFTQINAIFGSGRRRGPVAIKIKKTDDVNAADFSYDPVHRYDCKIIRAALLERGFEPTLDQCYEVWREVSQIYAAGWMILPDTNNEIYTMCYSHIKPVL